MLKFSRKYITCAQNIYLLNIALQLTMNSKKINVKDNV